MKKNRNPNVLARAKCTRTVYFDYDSDYVDFDSPKDMYPYYKLNRDYIIIAKVGQIFNIMYEEDTQQYVAYGNGGGIYFKTARELNDYEGFEITEFYDKEFEKVISKI